MSFYEYDPNDIAQSIQKAIDERADPAMVSYLMAQRNKKISENPQLANYANDAVAQAANSYIEKYAPVNTEELDMLYEARRDLAAENLAMAAQQNTNAFRAHSRPMPTQGGGCTLPISAAISAMRKCLLRRGLDAEFPTMRQVALARRAA